MAAESGVEIGRISIKVTPDTDGFRRKVVTEVTKAAKEAEQDIELGIEVTGEKEAEAKVDKVARPRKVKIKVDVDQPMFKNVDLRLDTDRVFQEFRRVHAEAVKARAEVTRVYSPARWFSQFNPNVIRNKIKAAFGKGIDVPINPDFKEPKGPNLFSKLIPNFGTGVNPAGMAAILAGALVVAAPVVGIITTALLALPGVISMIAVPIAAITLGLDGFKKAAEKIKPQFEGLKKVMSDAAETQFTPVLQNLADTIFPRLEASLPSVTAGLANMAQGAIDALNRDGNGTKLEESIRRIGDAFSNMRPGIDGFVSGFTGLIDQFTMKLPAITDWFNAARFIDDTLPS